MKKLIIKDYKKSDNLIKDIKKYFNEGVGIVGIDNKFLCEFDPKDKLDIELMEEVNHKSLKDLIITTCKFENERNVLTIEIELKGFEKVNAQLDILLDKCNKINKTDINFIKNNIIDEIARELSLKNTMIK